VTTALEELLRRHIQAGTIPGAVALLGAGDVAVLADGVAAVGAMRETRSCGSSR
jgi:hypothetical protein